MRLFWPVHLRHVLLSALSFLVAAHTVIACDICAIYSASQARGEAASGAFAGVAEQFTYFGTVQLEGQEIPNTVDQHLDSSISQVFAGYNFNRRLGLQLNLPVIYRSFRRPDGAGGVEFGTEAGVGDMPLLCNFTLVQKLSTKLTYNVTLFGGVKFPTGSTARLKEELSEVEELIGPPSGIHGHDLTLGSGSYDGVVGIAGYAEWHRLFVSAAAQYAIRSEGDYDYRFANDLAWSGGPGYYIALKDEFTFALQVVVSGESKGKDKFRSEAVEDTGITSVYAGPQLDFTWHGKLSAYAAADFPLSVDNTGLQTVPDYRIRAGVSWRF